MRHHSKAIKKLIAIVFVLLASNAYSQNIMLIDTIGDVTFGNGTTSPSPAAQQFFNVKKDFKSYSGLNRAIVSVTSTTPLGNSAVIQGTTGIKVRVVENSATTTATANNLVAFWAKIEPKVARIANSTSDMVGYVSENASPDTIQATDAYYISHMPQFTNGRPEWQTGFKMDANAFLAFGAQGVYSNGLDFVNGTQPATFSNAAIYLPINTGIKFRNAAASAPLDMIKSDASNNVVIGNGQYKIIANSGSLNDVSIGNGVTVLGAFGGGALFGTGSSTTGNVTIRSSLGGPNGIVLPTDVGVGASASSNRLFFHSASVVYANYVNANGVLGWAYGGTPGSASGTTTMTYSSAGLRLGDNTVATAKLHIAVGSSGSAGTAPIKLTAGTNLTNPEAGAVEFDGTDLFYTTSTPTRRTVANLTANQTFTNKTIAVGSNGITGTAGRVAQFNPSTGNLEAGSSAPAIAGSFSGSGSATTTYTVTIGATMAGTAYKVNATATNALSAASFYINNKTTTTFDVVYLTGLTGTVAFDWSVFP